MTDQVERSNAVHRKFETPEEWLHDIDGFLFPFNPEWETVAVNVSGGADSAMCTSLLGEIITSLGCDTKVKIISHSRVWQARPWQGMIQMEVYDELKRRYPDVIDERIENFVPPTLEEASAGPDLVNGRSGDRIIVGEFNQYAEWRYGIEAAYNAVTANPPKDEFEHTWCPKDRSHDIESMTKNEMITGHTLRPFMMISKDWVIGQYFKRGWEDLLDMTRSCEGDNNVMPDRFPHDYLTYVHGVTPLPTCGGECFWCAERDWAINKAKNGA